MGRCLGKVVELTRTDRDRIRGKKGTGFRNRKEHDCLMGSVKLTVISKAFGMNFVLVQTSK